MMIEFAHEIGRDDTPPETMTTVAVLTPGFVYTFCERDALPEIPSVPDQLYVYGGDPLSADAIQITVCQTVALLTRG
jgi:hypothetical protein